VPFSHTSVPVGGSYARYYHFICSLPSWLEKPFKYGVQVFHGKRITREAIFVLRLEVKSQGLKDSRLNNTDKTDA